MHPELEKLIDLAVVDGKVTEKEKEVLQRKARELNVDQDEFEMVLEAKLFIQNRDSQENQTLPTITETEARSSSEQKNMKVQKFFNEDYKEWLKKTVSKDKIVFKTGFPEYTIGLNLIDGVNSIKYLTENVTVNTHLENGELLLKITLEELLYHRLFDDIKFIFKNLPEAEFENDNIYIVKSYLDGEKEKSRNELEKFIATSDHNAEDFIFAAYCFSSLFNDYSSARKFLDQAEELRGDDFEFSRAALAQAWKQILNDNGKAIKCIRNIMKEYEDDYPPCGFIWKELLNDTREVKKFIRLQENEGIDWGYRTILFKRLFNDDNEAIRCLLELEKENEDFLPSLLDTAKNWKEILNDNNASRRCLERAESLAFKENEKFWLGRCAESWKELLNDEDSALRCTQKSQQAEKNPGGNLKEMLDY